MNPTAIETAQPWTLDAREVAAALDTHLGAGLPSEQAARRLDEVGPNSLVEQAQPGPWRIFARQLANTMTVVLALAGVVTLVIGDVKDTVVIGVIVVLNSVVGFVQEYRAERAMAALKELTTGTARVVRDGQLVDVPSPQVVPGDLVELVAGGVVPADLRLVDVHGLRINEAALTGESEPAAKTAEALAAGEGSMVADRHNMAFKGTAATYGRARGVVIATGMATELGQIATLLQAHAVEHTPLQRRLAVLGRRMAAAAIIVCAVVFGTGMARGETAEDMFLTSVSLAVAAIPEGLPAIVTVALALGARRMAERHAVIRRLPAVETLGSVTVICSDKTGTLTENRMMVERVWTPSGLYAVSGSGYAPGGELTGADDPAADDHLARLALVAAACNDAVLRRADIGVAMGIIGTDVSKEAADMVLTDDNFATIVHAVEEGRRIYDSIRRFVRYLLTTNSGEIWVMFLAPLLGMPLPLLPIQILWINLVTDGPPAIALGLEPAEPDTMRRPPRPPQESILAGGLWQHALWVGLLMAAVVLPLQAIARANDWPWQTMVFTTLALLQLGHALAVRSERQSLFRLGHRSNPWIGYAVALSAAAQLATVYIPALQDAFDTQALSLLQLAVVLALSTVAFVAVEIEKWWHRR